MRFIFLGLLFLTSCSPELISVHTDYLSHQNLASYHVGTPDPSLQCPVIGQRLIVSWSVPESLLSQGDLYIGGRIRFRNHQEAELTIPLTIRRGWYIYALTNEDYFETDGIQTYLLQLISNNEVIEEWRHQLWVELITFDEEPEDTGI